MNTHRETILTEVVTRLGPVAPTFRSRSEALDRGELPAIVVKPGAEQNEKIGNGVVRRAFQIVVEVHAAADSSNPAMPRTSDQIADTVIAPLHAALFVDKAAGTALGGIAGDLLDKEMQEPVFVDGDETRVAITLLYEAVYSTNEKDITTLSNH